MSTISRRRFLRMATALGVGAVTVRCTSPDRQTSEPAALTPQALPTTLSPTQPAVPASPSAANPQPAPTAAGVFVPSVSSSGANVGSAYLAVVRGADPAAIAERAIAAIGGIERFVKRGNDVIIKPNICSANRTYEYAATTNPEVVAALVRLCLGAGAARVRVMDYPFDGTPAASYARSGIEDAVKAAGGEMEIMAQMGFVETDIPGGVDLQRWPVYQPIMDADVLINVPVAKNHSLARLTLGGKNLMGTVQNREQIHRDLGQRVADITALVRPELTIIDAVRILMRNGPTGGNLDDVQRANTIVASADIVAADAWACSLFGVPPEEIGYISASAAMGLGTMDLSGIKVEELAV